jgi:hypothetical protein
MKKMKLFAVGAILVAGASAFATKAKPLVAGDYQSLKVGAGNCTQSSGHRNDCEGTSGICTIGVTTYFSDTNCKFALEKN